LATHLVLLLSARDRSVNRLLKRLRTETQNMANEACIHLNEGLEITSEQFFL
jgi:hypothetical protein